MICALRHFSSAAALALMAGGQLWAAEHVTLKNGFDLICDHIEYRGETDRLYLDRNSQFLEVRHADIVSVKHVSMPGDHLAPSDTVVPSTPSDPHAAEFRKLVHRFSSVADLHGRGRIEVTWLNEDLIDQLLAIQTEKDQLTPEQVSAIRQKAASNLDLKNDVVFLITFLPADGFSLSHCPPNPRGTATPPVQLVEADGRTKEPSFWSINLGSLDGKAVWYYTPSYAFIHFEARNSDGISVIGSKGFALTLKSFYGDLNTGDVYSVSSRFGFTPGSVSLPATINPNISDEDQAAVLTDFVKGDPARKAAFIQSQQQPEYETPMASASYRPRFYDDSQSAMGSLAINVITALIVDAIKGGFSLLSRGIIPE